MNNDDLYDQVARELQAKAMVPGVWARAFEKAGGDMDRARALYIKYRVVQLEEAKSRRLDKERKDERRESKKVIAERVSLGFRRVISGFLAVVFGFLTLGCSLGIIAPFTNRSEEHAIGMAVTMLLIAFLCGMVTHKCLKAAKE